MVSAVADAVAGWSESRCGTRASAMFTRESAASEAGYVQGYQGTTDPPLRPGKRANERGRPPNPPPPPQPFLPEESREAAEALSEALREDQDCPTEGLQEDPGQVSARELDSLKRKSRYFYSLALHSRAVRSERKLVTVQVLHQPCCCCGVGRERGKFKNRGEIRTPPLPTGSLDQPRNRRA
jgi:hypothetical protein